jgi:hypothetical protein
MNSTHLDLDLVQSKLQSGAAKFNNAVNSKDDSRRLELLEEALYEYVDIISCLNKLPEDVKHNIAYIILKQIHNIEQMMELEIRNRVHAETQKLYTQFDISA